VITLKKSLVVYYSLQGNTRKVADILAKQLNADTLELNLVTDYSVASAATLGLVHIRTKYAPKLNRHSIDLNDYDEIYIGTPVWWYSFAPPIRTFFRENDLIGKEIKLFSTHAGDNGNTFKNLRIELDGCNIADEKDYYTPKGCNWDLVKSEIEYWLK